MRISLPDQVKQDFAEHIAAALKLHLITPVDISDPASGLLSDDKVIAHIAGMIADQHSDTANDNGFLLNGYPRNIIQAQSLDIALAQQGLTLSAALISEAPETPQNRAKRALIRYYRSQNKLICLDDTASIEDICSKIILTHEKRTTPAVVK